MKPYPDIADNSDRIRTYSRKLSATRVVTENANALLKNKWKTFKNLNFIMMDRREREGEVKGGEEREREREREMGGRREKEGRRRDGREG